MSYIFDKNSFLEIANKKASLVVSIYTPTNRRSSDGYKEDKTHLKNMLAEAETSLTADHKLSKTQAKDFLKEARALFEAHDFWKYNADMLACFIFDGKAETISLPIGLEKPCFFIGEQAFMLPMVPELNDDGHYYLLSLNLDRIRLYEGTRNTFAEVLLDKEEIALSFIAEEKEIENQSNLQAQGGIGNAGAMYHGQGDGADEEKKRKIANYFDRMCNMLEPKLNQNPLPLYLAGVDYLIPIFRRSCKYNYLMDGHISGSFGEKDELKLHEAVWKLAEPYFKQERQRRKAAYEEKASKNMAVSNDRLRLIKAAINGAVDTLLVNKAHQHLRGSYDTETHTIKLANGHSDKSHCLIDTAAIHTLAQKGKVYLVDAEQIPDGNDIAGTLRYEL